MACEIERKFLVDVSRWQPADEGTKIMQCYLVRSPELSLRLRLAGDQAFLTIKGASHGISRSEFEYTIPRQDAFDMLKEFKPDRSIIKTRYCTQVGAHRWEIDVFEGDNRGLVVAEIELSSANESFIMPDWVTEEVSGDPRYRNACLAAHPYSQWPENAGS